jgi:23S rRNA (cytidine1920-2'-O)/16S rRNA (cytidine1409-2'-O)-methyltransferase
MPRHEGYVGRGGAKLKRAIDSLALDLHSAVAADFGCNLGGFTDCMLQEGAVRVYAVDTGYGMLDWGLRNDDRVVVMERTNAMHVELPEPVTLVAVDVGWTKQRNILPSALRQLGEGGLVLSLLKPQYEADRRLVRRGRVAPEDFEAVVETCVDDLGQRGFSVEQVIPLPHDRKRKNCEAILVVRP